MKTNIKNSRIKYKLTIKIPNTKLIADYLFHSKEELQNFVKLNEIKPFEIRSVWVRDPKF